MTPNNMLQPTPENVRQARRAADLSERAAGELVYVSRQSWGKYENGTTRMKLGLWELFLFKTGQLWIKPTVDAKRAPKSRGRVENLRPFAARAGAK